MVCVLILLHARSMEAMSPHGMRNMKYSSTYLRSMSSDERRMPSTRNPMAQRIMETVRKVRAWTAASRGC